MAENRDPITNSACDIKHSQGPTFALLFPANAIRSQASVCGCPFRKRGTVAVGERMRQWIKNITTLKIDIHIAQNIGKVWIRGKQKLLALFGFGTISDTSLMD